MRKTRRFLVCFLLIASVLIVYVYSGLSAEPLFPSTAATYQMNEMPRGVRGRLFESMAASMGIDCKRLLRRRTFTEADVLKNFGPADYARATGACKTLIYFYDRSARADACAIVEIGAAGHVTGVGFTDGPSMTRAVANPAEGFTAIAVKNEGTRLK